LEIHALKAGESMIRSENLRSGYIQDDVEGYLYQLLPERDAVIQEMEDYAEKNRVPIIGPAVARLLSLLVQVSGAKRIFEMGSAIGYSTIWLARAAGPKGKVIYTDGDPEKAKRAKEYFRRAGVAKRIDVRVGIAQELLKKTPGTFDLIFNDIDKQQYPDALRAALPKIKRGGLLITDNTLWSGKAARPAAVGDADTLGIQEFNRLVYDSKQLYPVLIPLRDGVTVCRKN
jgi:caffeoyl-CoA O-methyltransferase